MSNKVDEAWAALGLVPPDVARSELEHTRENMLKDQTDRNTDILDNESLKRARFSDNRGIYYPRARENAPSRALDLYCRILASSGLWTVLHSIKFWLPAKMLEYHSDKVVIAFAGEVNNYYKLYGTDTDLGDSWYFWEGIKNAMADYQRGNDMSLVDEVRLWVGPDVGFSGDMKEMHKQIIQISRSMVDNSQALPGDVKMRDMSFLEFLSRPGLWAKSGSSTIKAGRVELYGKSLKIGNTKWGLAYSYTPRELEVRFWDTRYTAQSVTIGKRETKKVRAVINADVLLYLGMSYIDYVTKPYQKKIRWLPMYYGLSHNMEAMKSVCDDIAAKRGYFFPLDQSGFDQHVSREQFLSYMEGRRERIRLSATPRKAEGLKVLNRCVQLMKQSVVLVRDKSGDVVLPWMSGMLSGLLWTADGDSVINRADFYYCCKRAGVDPFFGSRFQGDDVQTRLSKATDALKITEAYNNAGLEAHPHKMWLSRIRDEFLRRLYTSKGVIGYPARGITSILWRNPIGDDDVSTIAECQRIKTNWLTMAARGCDEDACKSYAAEELSRILSLAKNVCLGLLQSSSAFGGLGWGSDMSYKITSVVDEEATETYDKNIQQALRLPPSDIVSKEAQVKAWGSRLKIRGIPKPRVAASVEPIRLEPIGRAGWFEQGGTALQASLSLKREFFGMIGVSEQVEEELSMVRGAGRRQDALAIVLKYYDVGYSEVARGYDHLSWKLFKEWVLKGFSIPLLSDVQYSDELFSVKSKIFLPEMMRALTGREDTAVATAKDIGRSYSLSTRDFVKKWCGDRSYVA
jgi:hypothetical protein